MFLRRRSQFSPDQQDAGSDLPRARAVRGHLRARTASRCGRRPSRRHARRAILTSFSCSQKDRRRSSRSGDRGFESLSLRQGVEKLDDLKPDMVLEGVVTNVAAFGAFVDVGVHQDGLVHISAMANAYVKDPRKIAKPGDVVRVKVLEVDPKRRRISLTMRLDQALEARPTTERAAIAPTDSDKRLRPAETRAGRSNSVPASGDAMAEAFRRAGLTGKTPAQRAFGSGPKTRAKGSFPDPAGNFPERLILFPVRQQKIPC
jgi:predicted RNA-binding protein with RPS1 domain